MLRFDDQVGLVVLMISDDGATYSDEVTDIGISQGIGPNNSFYHSISVAISKLDVPVIAVIEEDAFGRELEWILACDIRIACKTSCFGLPQVRRGRIPSEGGTQRLPRLVGMGKALEMILTGECIKAREALKIGSVNKVVTASDLTKTVMELANDIASKSPNSMRFVKEAIYKGMDQNLDQELRLEADLYFLMHTTNDRTEGIRAFQEKRKAHFDGR
jgi:enoyl-CoA hydratase/carnithine racemase